MKTFWVNILKSVWEDIAHPTRQSLDSVIYQAGLLGILVWFIFQPHTNTVALHTSFKLGLLWFSMFTLGLIVQLIVKIVISARRRKNGISTKDR